MLIGRELRPKLAGAVCDNSDARTDLARDGTVSGSQNRIARGLFLDFDMSWARYGQR